MTILRIKSGTNSGRIFDMSSETIVLQWKSCILPDRNLPSRRGFPRALRRLCIKTNRK